MKRSWKVHRIWIVPLLCFIFWCWFLGFSVVFIPDAMAAPELVDGVLDIGLSVDHVPCYYLAVGMGLSLLIDSFCGGFCVFSKWCSGLRRKKST